MTGANHFLVIFHQVTFPLVILTPLLFYQKKLIMSDGVVQSLLYKYLVPYPEDLTIYANKLFHYRVMCRGNICCYEQLTYLMFITSLESLLWSLGKLQQNLISQLFNVFFLFKKKIDGRPTLASSLLALINQDRRVNYSLLGFLACIEAWNLE